MRLIGIPAFAKTIVTVAECIAVRGGITVAEPTRKPDDPAPEQLQRLVALDQGFAA